MKRVHLVCDSTADLGPAYYPAHAVEMVPLRIIFGDQEFRDQVELSTGEFYRRMRAGGPHPRTSQPPPSDFQEVFERLGGDGDTVICTTISSDLSGTAGSAMQARQSLPDLDIRVVESKSCGPAHGAAVDLAVAIRDRGGGADAIVSAIERLRATQRLVFTVENLEYLRRGGRIGTARALLGTVLSIKPILGFIDGKVQALDQVRTYQRALDRLVQELASAVRGWGQDGGHPCPRRQPRGCGGAGPQGGGGHRGGPSDRRGGRGARLPRGTGCVRLLLPSGLRGDRRDPGVTRVNGRLGSGAQ